MHELGLSVLLNSLLLKISLPPPMSCDPSQGQDLVPHLPACLRQGLFVIFSVACAS